MRVSNSGLIIHFLWITVVLFLMIIPSRVSQKERKKNETQDEAMNISREPTAVENTN